MEHIKKHFNEEATIYDVNIRNLIPYYSRMVEALISSLPYSNNEKIEVIDLGSGTGTISKAVKEKYPNASITCLDIAENMLETAKQKLAGYKNISFVQGNFENYKFDKSYDLIISSLALHHLRTDEEKCSFYQQCYDCLKQNGYFFNADVMLAASENLQKVYMDKWVEYMRRNVSEDEIQNTWLPTYYNEDSPAKLTDHIQWMNEIGFKEIDVIWKYYNFAVYGGKK